MTIALSLTVAIVVLCAPSVAAAALVPLAQDLTDRHHTHREQQWLTETKDHQS